MPFSDHFTVPVPPHQDWILRHMDRVLRRYTQQDSVYEMGVFHKGETHEEDYYDNKFTHFIKAVNNYVVQNLESSCDGDEYTKYMHGTDGLENIKVRTLVGSITIPHSKEKN
jgi:hypothetical protein